MKDMHVCEEERNINNGESVVKMEEQSVDPNPNPNYQTQDQTVNWVEEVVTPEDREIWFEREQEDLLDVNDAFISYGDFPPLPDFPCISSSSSSSSSDPPVVANSMKCSASSSSSSSSLASWALVKPDGENCMKNMKIHHQQEDLMSMSSMEVSMQEINPMDSDCMDVIEEFHGMDLLDTDLWDPSSLFPFENNTEEEEQQQQEQLVIQQDGLEEKQEAKPSEDLAMLFFEWLKLNKESISAEDLRSIKLKRSTIECAAKRLGGGKEGMKQLLKLILEWVQNHQLQKKRVREGGEPITFPYQHQQNPQHHYQNPNPNPNPNPDSNPYIIPSTAAATPWISQPPYISDPMTMSGAFPPMVGYMGDPVFNNGGFATVPFNPEYQMMDSSPNWPQQQFSFSTHYNSYPDRHLHHQRHLPPAQSRLSRAFTAFANQYPCQLYQSHADQLVRFGSSATKEARKKRMARQRRLFSHNRSQNQKQNRIQNRTVATAEQHEGFSSDSNCTSTHANQANWVFWPSSSSVGASTMLVPDAPPHSTDRPPLQAQHYQRQINLDRRHGFKTGNEKNLKFLLQKVLKQSDVGNLGRIVLPKKEAEAYLPELEARDGISIAMEDIGTSRIWNMRYRFWPNNKSRMYLLENTGDFVRSNGLQEGDFIVIYSDVKCGKYLIRGVKVHQPGSRSEGKKHGKVQRKLRATSVAGGVDSSSSVKGKL